LQKYNTQNKTLDALLFEAKQIEYLMLTNVYPIGSIDVTMVQTIADTYKQKMPSYKIIDARIQDFIFASNDSILTLTNAQKQYLRQKKVLTMCVDPNWMPLEAIQEGVHTGIAAEVLQIVSNKLQTPIRLVQTNTWSQSLQKAKNRECDILSLAENTPKRAEYLDFTLPYVQTPLVIATKTGLPFFSNLEEIKQEPLGVVADFSIVELLKQKYPNINLVEVSSVAQGLQAVQKEKLFGLLDNAIVLNDQIHKLGINDVVISGQFEDSFALSIATRNDEPQLHQVMQKALLSIDKSQIQEIMSKWSNISYQTVPDYKLISQILFLTVVGLGVFAYWNMRLKDEIRQKDEAKAKLRASEEKFRTLFDLAPVMIDSFDKNGRVVLWNKECQKVFGWSKEELLASKDPLGLFYPNSEDKDAVIANLNESFAYKEWYPVTKEGKKLVTMWANVHMPNGEIVHVGYDVTTQRADEALLRQKTLQLKAAKEELENLNKTLENRVKLEIEKNLKHQMLLLQQNRLAQMGEMIENIAHQWRQPLAQINSCVLMIDGSFAKERIQQSVTIFEKLNEIETLTSYMSKTIDDFTNFFHPEKEKREFGIDELVQNTYTVVKGALKAASIDFTSVLDKNYRINSYIKELEHVLIIIVNNAKDALLEKVENGRKIILEACEDEKYVFIKISDNGGGIEAKNLNKVFEPYFSTKHKSQGTGLGLYMAKMIIEEGLNGHLSAYNHGEGATFEIAIPKEASDG
jgi:PAS domain S-box-containing protein